MTKIVIIIVYFGKLPDYFPFFMKGVKNNKDVDFLMFTDQNIISDFDNFKIINFSFAEMRKIFCSKFDFPIALNSPYKFCDFKPSYGYVFSDYISSYDFWGHCDIDLVFGNIRKFVTDDILCEYDKIYRHGHLCLYKNTDTINRAFMMSGPMDYRKVFSSSYNWIFDETNGVQKIFDNHNLKTYKSNDMADIAPQHFRMRRAYDTIHGDLNYKKQVFYYDSGSIFRAYVSEGKVFYDELCYLHFQKRKLNLKCDESAMSFIFTSNSIVSKNAEISLETIYEIDKFSLCGEVKKRISWFKFQMKRRLNKYILKKGI